MTSRQLCSKWLMSCERAAASRLRTREVYETKSTKPTPRTSGRWAMPELVALFSRRPRRRIPAYI